MADRELQGKDFLLFLDPAGGTDYKVVVCLTANNFNRSRNTSETSTFCGTKVSYGPEVLEVGASGEVILDTSATKTSLEDLDVSFRNNTVVGWKLGETTPTTGSITYTGTGRISQLNLSNSAEGAAQFEITIKPDAGYTTVITP